ncbi:MAG: hypothetical protein KatS3mg110_1197 [Pirellulaceae bacterium]|nr:MAG: hypothetical protein KatS3mg110_1197 [Pirellulaceae bacterium]
MGVDFGLRRIGLSLCDTGRRFATPYAVYHRQSPAADAIYFRRLVQREEITGFVVGLPVHADGRESELSRQARAFGQWLEEQTRIPVQFLDERYTTQHAEALLREAGLKRSDLKRKRDMIAAQIILSVFLESPHLARQPSSPLEDPPQDQEPY